MPEERLCLEERDGLGFGIARRVIILLTEGKAEVGTLGVCQPDLPPSALVPYLVPGLTVYCVPDVVRKVSRGEYLTTRPGYALIAVFGIGQRATQSVD